jgi:hypothetical protein
MTTIRRQIVDDDAILAVKLGELIRHLDVHGDPDIASARSRLTEAQQALASAKANYSAGIEAVNVAITDGDVERIKELQNAVSIELPNAVTAAQLAVHDCRLALLEILLLMPDHIMAEAQARIDEAKARAAIITAELETLTIAYGLASRDLMDARRAPTQIRSMIEGIARDKQEAVEGMRSRFMRLAGLPPQQSAGNDGGDEDHGDFAAHRSIGFGAEPVMM